MSITIVTFRMFIFIMYKNVAGPFKKNIIQVNIYMCVCVCVNDSTNNTKHTVSFCSTRQGNSLCLTRNGQCCCFCVFYCLFVFCGGFGWFIVLVYHFSCFLYIVNARVFLTSIHTLS